MSRQGKYLEIKDPGFLRPMALLVASLLAYGLPGAAQTQPLVEQGIPPLRTEQPSWQGPAGLGVASQSFLFGVDLGSDDSSSTLFRIDSAQGDLVVVAELGIPNFGDIDFLPDGRLFGVRTDGPGELITINPRNGATSAVGPVGFTGIVALVAESSDSLLAATWDGELVRIDPLTGSGSLIGTFGSGLISAGDLAFDDNGTLFGTACVGSCIPNPGGRLVEIDIATGVATQIGPIGFDHIYGLAFHAGTVFNVGGVPVRGPTLFAVSDGEAAKVPSLISIDRRTGAGQLISVLLTTDGMSGLAANSRVAPTRGLVEMSTFATSNPSNDCQTVPLLWNFCQPKAPPYVPGLDVDDTFAWEINLAASVDMDKPAYAIANGTVVSFYGEVPPGGGTDNAVLIEHCYSTTFTCDCQASPTDCWWSRYLHMEGIQVVENQQVTAGTLLGFLSDVDDPGFDPLHFGVYEGENRRAGSQGLLQSVDTVMVPDVIFADRFESGDTSAWAFTVPTP